MNRLKPLGPANRCGTLSDHQKKEALSCPEQKEVCANCSLSLHGLLGMPLTQTNLASEAFQGDSAEREKHHKPVHHLGWRWLAATLAKAELASTTHGR